MSSSAITPQQIAQWKLFNPQQNPLYPSAPTGDPSQATPPPSSASPAPPAEAPQSGQISSAMKPPTEATPNAPIANAPTPFHHGTLAKIMLGIGEAVGNPLATHIGQRDRERQQEVDEYTRSLPAMQNQANLARQQEEANIAEKQRQGRYVTPRSGGVFDVTTGGYAPGAEPTEKPEAPHTVETGAGVFQYNDKTGKYDIPVGPPKAQAKTPSFDEQSYEEWHQTHPKGTRMQYEADKSRATQKPPAEPKQMVVAPDGTVLELHPGDKVPAGSKTPSKYGEPSADEQRRSDLAGNLNENFDQLEDIVKRRPELFGPLAGRWTELKGKFGSDDPDIAALSTLEHQIGMAQISAHGMRSSHGIEGASKSILNGFHSGPAAIMAAINTARKSVGTFQNDVATAKGETQPKPAAQPGGKKPASSNDPLGIR